MRLESRLRVLPTSSSSLAAVTVVLLWLALAVTGLDVDPVEVEPAYWQREARRQLDAALEQPGAYQIGWEAGPRRAKNVVFFLGDGMGVSTVTGMRYMKAQLMGKWAGQVDLVWEAWPSASHIRTFDLERLTTDSAASATAYLTGKSASLLFLKCLQCPS
ncbi:unnamed protein product [Protopolystoma xenopodis]|uniref:alkaline phosphatase n=1 Tax=Protopolystoma xenopodis TaxID=117903 RepID=A0A448X8E5_9PLAT|nr:unnamed protein product [Protopolystoma xenopodis]